MALTVLTSDPHGLLAAIKQEIKAKKIETWSVDNDGDFTHAHTQWANKAWFRPAVQTDRLIFTILNPQNQPISTTIYGMYHGRFIEMLLNHFDARFTRAYASSFPELGDVVG